MRPLTQSPLLALAVVGTQLLGPAVLWSADQRGIRIETNRRVVVSALSGQQVTAQSGGGTKALEFRDTVNVGDQLATDNGTMAEVLIGNRAVIILDHNTAARFTTVSDEQVTIQVTKGIVRVAAAASALGEQGIVTVQTPTGQVQTRGGIVRVMVDVPAGSAEQVPTGEPRLYLASYLPDTVVAAISNRSDIIQVEEGMAEIPGASPGGKAVTLQVGQSVKIQSGQPGFIAGLVTRESLRTNVVATTGHLQTPKEGRDHLVALQVEQATALGNALTGAAETGKGEAGRKDHLKNVINGATGGVLLTNPSLVSSLFGGGSTANPTGSTPQDRTGTGYGGNNNNGLFIVTPASDVNVKFNGGSALLVFTRKDPVEPFVKADKTLPIADNLGFLVGGTETFQKDAVCSDFCFASHYYDAQKDPNGPSDQIVLYSNLKPLPANVGYRPSKETPLVQSNFSVEKELILIGGTPNEGHGGKAPTDTLIVRGGGVAIDGSVENNLASGFGFKPTDRLPARLLGFPAIPREIAAANSTFVVEEPSFFGIHKNANGPGEQGNAIIGGTLGQYSDDPVLMNGTHGLAIGTLNGETSHVDGAITATDSSVVLTGGVTLDQGTRATIGTTPATQTYFTNLSSSDTKYSGSLLAVIRGSNNSSTALTLQDRLLGVYDGSTITTNGGNKALLSVLDAKLTGPSSSIPLIDIAAGSHFDREGAVTPGSAPDVKVTSALVTRSTIPVDGALLEASAPLFALTKATMTTTSHFADLAGNGAQSLRLTDTLVALNGSNDSKLTIENGHLLNLHAATASVTGYLFSLNNSSTLTLDKGALFSLTDGSSLTLNANAFGVFGSGNNTLSIDNNLCPAGACFQLVNSANQPILVNNVTPLNVAGATQNVVLPNNFNVFARAGASEPTVVIGADDALFRVDGTSTLTINGTTIVGE